MQASVALAGALDLGRILVFDSPDSNVYLSDEYCKDAKAFDQCYFLPLSNCSAGVRLPIISSNSGRWWFLLMKAQMGDSGTLTAFSFTQASNFPTGFRLTTIQTRRLLPKNFSSIRPG